MSITARYFDVGTGQFILRPLNHLTRELCFSIEPLRWPVAFDADAVPGPTPFKTRIFRLTDSPDAGRGIYDYVFHRTRNS